MFGRRGSFRPSSLDEIFSIREKNKTSNSSAVVGRKKDSLSKTKKRTGKDPVTGLYNIRKKGQDELQRIALGLELSEDQSQMQVIDWCKLQPWKTSFLSDRIHHSPNGGKRTISEAGRFKAMGTKSGFPDLILLIPVAPYHGLFIEMKVSDGKLSEVQKAYHVGLVEEGYKVVTCYSVDEAINQIKIYLSL